MIFNSNDLFILKTVSINMAPPMTGTVMPVWSMRGVDRTSGGVILPVGMARSVHAQIGGRH